MALVLRNPGKTIPSQYLITGLILVVLCACKVSPGSETPPPPPGGIQITVSGQPQSFFDSLTCRYAICQSGGDPNDPSDRIAEGAFSLSSGSGVSDVENLVASQYDLYIVVDVDGDGYTFSPAHLFDGDLHDAKMKIPVEDIVIDRSFTLKAVTGEVTWTGLENGDLYVVLCTHVSPPPSPGFEVKQQVNYYGISNATSAMYALDVTDPVLYGEPYYLLGALVPLGGNITTPLHWSWYLDASATEGTDTPPVNLSTLQDSYDFELDK